MAAVSPQAHAWQQPILRLAVTIVGVAVAWTGIRVKGSCRLDLLPPPKAKTDLPERATVRGPRLRLPPSVVGGATRLPPARWIG